MPIYTTSIGPLETNCHIIAVEGCAVAVDVGGEPTPVLELLTQNALRLVAVCITHLHFDHLYGVAALHKATGASVYAPNDDAHLMQSELGSGGVWGFARVAPFDWSPLTLGQQRFGPIQCTVLHTPGHTPGSVSLYFPQENAVCSGDALFYRSIGRTDFPGGNLDTLLKSIREQLFTLPPKTRILPGHGPETTVDAEQRHNPFCGAFAQ